MKKFISVLVCLGLIFTFLCACTNNNDITDDTNNMSQTADHQQVKVKMENGGEFIIELYPEYAPETVDNFISLVNDGFYNGLGFHRVMKDFMAQGGEGKGNEKIKQIKGEFASNGFEKNTLSHTRGIVSMARGPEMDSASSQFFICYSDDCNFLDGDYAAFGKVTEGMEVVDDFLKVPMTYNIRGEKAVPTEPIIIESMEVISA